MMQAPKGMREEQTGVGLLNAVLRRVNESTFAGVRTQSCCLQWKHMCDATPPPPPPPPPPGVGVCMLFSTKFCYLFIVLKRLPLTGLRISTFPTLQGVLSLCREFLCGHCPIVNKCQYKMLPANDVATAWAQWSQCPRNGSKQRRPPQQRPQCVQQLQQQRPSHHLHYPACPLPLQTHPLPHLQLSRLSR